MGNIAKEKNWKSGHIGLLHRSVGNQRHRVDLRQGVGSLAAARLRGKNGTPRVRNSVEKLSRSVSTIHRGQIFGFLFRKSSFCTPIV